MKLNTFYREEFNKWWYLGSIFYLLTITLYKTSVILLLRRIFVQRGFQIACWCALVVNSCWGLGNIFGLVQYVNVDARYFLLTALFRWLFQCLPIPSMWGAVPATCCFDLHGLWISITAWDVSSDLGILIMPIPMVWKLNLKFGQKTIVTGVFLLGAVVVIFSLMSCSAVVSNLGNLNTQKNLCKFINRPACSTLFRSDHIITPLLQIRLAWRIYSKVNLHPLPPRSPANQPSI